MTALANLQTIPIDDPARDGRYQLVFGAGEYAVVRWAEPEGWIFTTGHRLDFEPETYSPHQGEAAA